MKRLLLCAALLFGALAVASPTEAHTEACGGVGTMTTATALQLRVLPPPQPITTAQFSMAFTAGLCGKTFLAQGTLTGWCWDFWGYGITNTGHRFAVTVDAGKATFTGELKGLGTVTPDPGCLPSSARHLITASVAKVHGGLVVTPQPLEAYCANTWVEC